MISFIQHMCLVGTQQLQQNLYSLVYIYLDEQPILCRKKIKKSSVYQQIAIVHLLKEYSNPKCGHRKSGDSSFYEVAHSSSLPGFFFNNRYWQFVHIQNKIANLSDHYFIYSQQSRLASLNHSKHISMVALLPQVACHPGIKLCMLEVKTTMDHDESWRKNQKEET